MEIQLKVNVPFHPCRREWEHFFSIQRIDAVAEGWILGKHWLGYYEISSYLHWLSPALVRSICARTLPASTAESCHQKKRKRAKSWTASTRNWFKCSHSREGDKQLIISRFLHRWDKAPIVITESVFLFFLDFPMPVLRKLNMTLFLVPSFHPHSLWRYSAGLDDILDGRWVNIRLANNL